MKGGFLYDYTTIYWKGAKTADFSENGYYRVPTNPWRDSVTVYIDDDVNGLMIVPYVFRWATFEVRSARIRKYNIDDLHPETGVKLK